MRIKIYVLCLVSASYTFIHYCVIKPKYRADMFFMNEIFRYLIMFAICYYYCDKSSGLLKSKRQLLKTLKIMGIISVTAISCVGVSIIVGIKLGKIDQYALCSEIEFQSFRYYSIATCFFFFYIYVQIRKSILAHPRET